MNELYPTEPYPLSEFIPDLLVFSAKMILYSPLLLFFTLVLLFGIVWNDFLA